MDRCLRLIAIIGFVGAGINLGNSAYFEASIVLFCSFTLFVTCEPEGGNGSGKRTKDI